MFRIIFVSMILFAVLITHAQAKAATETKPEDSISSEEKLVRGERMYRKGIMPSGEPIQAIVSSDVPVDGRMFTCVNCHQRSGLGSEEGSIITWPINGKQLYAARRRTGAWNAAKQAQGPGARERWSLPTQYQAADARPAYTDESLARLLREGIDPAGRKLQRAMPRYQIDNSNMQVLTHYLKNLSGTHDEGADKNRIRFATVVTEGVSAEDKEAMLAVLQNHIDTHNTQTRPHQRRARAGPFYKTEKYGAYRQFELDVWELNGPADTWKEQLEAYYQAGPVFAMLGGIASGSWAPIHQFCEEREIPSIFPVTDQPVISDEDWYTLYLSKGLYQDGEAAVRYLRSDSGIAQDSRVVQIYRNDSKGAILAQGFRENLGNSGDISITDHVLSTDEPVTDKMLKKIFEAQQPAAVMLWLENTDTTVTTDWLLKQPQKPGIIFASWKLLEGDTSVIPDGLRDSVYLTYPRDLPEDNTLKINVLKRWLTIRKIPVTNLDIQSQMYFLGWMLPGVISHLRSEFYRDYFIESFDMMHDQDYAIAVFPRLTFGPGQRYASKGCYVVQLGEGESPKLIKRSEWIIH